ncbi:adhesion G protein-coupled receptor F5-like isoform X2 [Cebidichthys violaceus]|uniref:adhesion G protein-coupled receptor F5-like isoform X2 n=1 Tax=Cebidichthys violaceus TaxID=271503 RepID=UPI0035C97D00
MAIPKNGLVIIALLLTTIILETGNFSSHFSTVHYEEDHFVSHIREKRTVTTDQWNYIIEVVVNASNVETIQQIRSVLNATSFPKALDNSTEISDISITTVCSSNATSIQCRCEEHFAWPDSICVTYGACDEISSGICKCIDGIPADGQSCQSISALLTQVEYAVDVELNVTDIETVDYLRSLLESSAFTLALGPTVNVTHIVITTVCFPNDTNFQCWCEEQYVWSFDNCITYGACDEIIGDTCQCINSIPTNGQYCQPQTVFYEYQIFIEVNTTDVDQLRNTLNSISFPVQISNQLIISEAIFTTVCSQNLTEIQCQCEDDYLWPCDKCATYGKCDSNTTSTCGCIKAFPIDGQYCQSIKNQNFTTCPQTTTSPTTDPPLLYEYVISVELNISDVTQINRLRSILRNIIYPVSINDVQIYGVNISTVCYPSSGYQCRCEDQYRWSCDQCLLYGSCDNITEDTCGCINAIPSDGQYCQSADQHNFTACNISTTTPSPPSSTGVNTTAVTTTPTTNVTNATTGMITTAVTTTPTTIVTSMNTTAVTTTPTTNVTTPPVIYEYVISIELNTTDVAGIELLRNISYPIRITANIQVSDLNISTVCYPSRPGYQCRCEDQYRWSCDQCLMYGSCNNITEDTCGCINAIPSDGQYCQPADQHNFTACNISTTTPSPPTTTGVNTTAVTTTPTTNVTNATTGMITTAVTTTPTTIVTSMNTTAVTTTPTTNVTTPPVIYEYVISIELNTTDVAGIELLRNISYPIRITANIQVSDLNISTVCYPSRPGYQCRCEDQYRWSCDQCLMYGSCNNITEDTCGCINAIPSDGQYCQPADQHNFTACNISTTTPSPPSSTGVNTTAVTTTPTTNVTNATTGMITTAVTTTPTTIVTIATSTPAPNTNPTTATSTKAATTTTTTTRVPPTIPITVATSTPAPNTNPTTATSTKAATTTTTTTRVPPTIPITVATSTPAPNTNPTTATSTKAATTTTTTTRVPPTIPITEFNVEMAVELNMTYTADLNDKSSSAYKDLESRINDVLLNEYKGLTGFVNVSVTGFSEGSIVTDFTVQTRQIILPEVINANTNLPKAMAPIAEVIGSVTAVFKSPIPITSSPDIIYTGRTMTLMCDDKLNEGDISGSVWTFKGREIKSGGRIIISNFGVTSSLKVDNVILRDIGRYECTLTGSNISFSQNGDVTKEKIKKAPIIRVQSQVNVKCKEGQKQSLQCCVQSTYTIKWFRDSELLSTNPVTNNEENCIKYDYTLSSCSEPRQIVFTCKVESPLYEEKTVLNVFRDDVVCNAPPYGEGQEGDISSIGCDEGLEGFKKAQCQSSGEWRFLEDTCIVTEIKELLIDSESLDEETIPEFVADLNMTVTNEQSKISNSSATIAAIVDIIGNIAAIITDDVSQSVIEDVLGTVDVIIGDDSRESWESLNANETRNSSSRLLGSLESLASGLAEEVNFATQRILLNSTTFNNSFMADLNSSVVLVIPNDINLINILITTITFRTLNNVMPTRNSSFDTSLFNANSNETVINDTINAAVVLVQINRNETIRNVTLSYSKLNESLSKVPQCVFWNFALFGYLGGWDDEGCTFVSDINNTVTCNCNHLTSFSLLMATDIPPDLREALDIITYVGVAISLASLVICLIIEGYVWKAITRNSTAFMRHVSIINTALSLLIADICFIIGASIAKNPLENPGEDFVVPLGPCSTATFFMHFFYLAVFFWMLVSGLLLFYRTVMVFSHMSRSIMLSIGFLLGYGCPLIIAVITVAVTAPGNGYIRKDEACWLNWLETHALLAMVIPALVIVSINLVIVIVVLFKMLRRGVGDAAQTDERHTLVVILRCVVILTPLFGLTWALGIGTMISSTNKGIHIAFAFFNSLQGLFILVFGTLFDSKIRSILSRTLPTSSTGSNNTTRSTSGGVSSNSGLSWINRLRGRRYMYHVSEAANSRSTGASESYSNI